MLAVPGVQLRGDWHHRHRSGPMDTVWPDSWSGLGDRTIGAVVAVRRDWRSSVAVVYITQILMFLERPNMKPLSLPRRRRAGTGQKKSMSPCGCSCLCCLVRGKRLELSRLAALEPKSSASTNSAIPALLRRSGAHYTRPPHEAALVQTRTPLPERRARVTSFRVRRYPRNARCRPRRGSCPTAPR